MKRLRLWIVLSLLVLLYLPGCTDSIPDATTPDYDLLRVSGSVYNAITEQYISGAKVYVADRLVSTSDSRGEYAFTLSPGSYELSFDTWECYPYTYRLEGLLGGDAVVDAALYRFDQVAVQSIEVLDGDNFLGVDDARIWTSLGYEGVPALSGSLTMGSIYLLKTPPYEQTVYITAEGYEIFSTTYQGLIEKLSGRDATLTSSVLLVPQPIEEIE